jgi:hypothetical protein
MVSRGVVEKRVRGTGARKWPGTALLAFELLNLFVPRRSDANPAQARSSTNRLNGLTGPPQMAGASPCVVALTELSDITL